jgi:hypothetical protein
MLLIGCTPPERHIEQHDVFFGIGESTRDMVPQMRSFWPGENRLHVDAWRLITRVNGYNVEVVAREPGQPGTAIKLFFINLGGYKQNEFEEFHYKMVIAAPDKAEAISIARQTAFFRHTGFDGANSHIDDKYGVDVDEACEIMDILPPQTKERYCLRVSPGDSTTEDELHLGYFKLSML